MSHSLHKSFPHGRSTKRTTPKDGQREMLLFLAFWKGAVDCPRTLSGNQVTDFSGNPNELSSTSNKTKGYFRALRASLLKALLGALFGALFGPGPLRNAVKGRWGFKFSANMHICQIYRWSSRSLVVMVVFIVIIFVVCLCSGMAMALWFVLVFSVCFWIWGVVLLFVPYVPLFILIPIASCIGVIDKLFDCLCCFPVLALNTNQLSVDHRLPTRRSWTIMLKHKKPCW